MLLHEDPAWRDVFHGAPGEHAVARLDRWPRANPGAWIRLYHGTSAALPVRQDGLLPTEKERRNTPQSRSGYVSFSVYPRHAKTFGRLSFPEQPIAVYGVDLRVDELVPDRDQLRNERIWEKRSVKNTLTHSLAFGRCAQVRGPVAAERVFIVTVVEPPRLAENAPTVARERRTGMTAGRISL